MDQSNETINIEGQISSYVASSNGLELKESSDGQTLHIFQKADGKILKLTINTVEEVISRIDNGEKPFLQINFLDGRKLLLTEKLIGFKPALTTNLDMSKLPKVVTTPDLVSVVEAIEESMHSEETHPEEINVLKRVFDSVLRGGEAIGFDLNNERTWLNMITNTKIKPSA